MIRIFISTEPNQAVASAVLKHSIASRTKDPVSFTELSGLDLGMTQKMFTGFSIYRFHVPFLAGYSGRAISMDTDIVCLADISELYRMKMTSAAMAKRRDVSSFATSVMLLDCEKLKNWNLEAWAPALNSSKAVYEATMWGRNGGLSAAAFSELDKNWNQFDVCPDGTKMIHYTSLPRQPWKARGHAHADIFLRELKKALQAGVLKEADVLSEESKGHVYAGLLEDAKHANV